MTSSEIKYRAQAKEVCEAMEEIGHLWGLGRPVRPTELGRALRTSPKEPGQTIRGWMTGKIQITGPGSVAIEMFRLGALPPDGLSAVLSPKKKRARPTA